jgi:hypothetical protein
MVPRFIFIAKFGIIFGFLCNYQASLGDDTIFPAEKRATCIGQCQLVARAVTVLVYEIAELPKP